MAQLWDRLVEPKCSRKAAWFVAPELHTVDRIVARNPGFYSMNLKAEMLVKMGRTEEAIAVAEEALESGKKELGKNQFLTQDQLDAFAATVEKWRATRVATR